MKKILFLFLLSTVALNSFAGSPLKRGYIYACPKLEFTDNIYATPLIGLGSGIISGYAGDSFTGLRYILPHAITRFLLENKIVTPAGDAKMKWWDWKLKNHSIGYNFIFQPTVSHWGVVLELDYEKQSRMAILPGETDYSDFSKKMVTPGITLQYQFSDLIDSPASLNLYAGAKYNYAFRCSGLSEDVHSVNNGFTGSVGLGFAVAPLISESFDDDSLQDYKYINFRIMYSRDLFNYFNPEFVDAEGNKPYEGWNTKYGYLTLSFLAQF